MAEDRRGKRVSKISDNSLLAGHPCEFSFFLITKWDLLTINSKFLFLQDIEGYEIDICIEYGPHLILFSLDLASVGTVYSDQFHPIARTEPIHILIVSYHCDRGWRFSFHHQLGKLLEFNVLLICEP